MATLPFTIQKQPELNLCWAACGSSIYNYYDPGPLYTICDIANAQLGRTDCCTDLTICDKQGYLDQALTYTHNYRGAIAGIPDFGVIQQEIGNGLLIALRVLWHTNNQGHFIVIHGCHDDETIDVQDPWPTRTPGTIALTQLAYFYNDLGEITHTFFTKRATDPLVSNISINQILHK